MSYMIDIRDYVVERTTTDKLQELLNEMAYVFDELAPTFTGGRDWVVVGSRPAQDAPEHGFGNVGSKNRVRVP